MAKATLQPRFALGDAVQAPTLRWEVEKYKEVVSLTPNDRRLMVAAHTRYTSIRMLTHALCHAMGLGVSGISVYQFYILS